MHIFPLYAYSISYPFPAIIIDLYGLPFGVLWIFFSNWILTTTDTAICCCALFQSYPETDKTLRLKDILASISFIPFTLKNRSWSNKSLDYFAKSAYLVGPQTKTKSTSSSPVQFITPNLNLIILYLTSMCHQCFLKAKSIETRHWFAHINRLCL